MNGMLMRVWMVAAGVGAALMAGCASAPRTDERNVVEPGETAPGDLSHLPEALQRDIEAWRVKLATARCLKVVSRTDETWANVHELDESGSARVVLRERFELHSWMTPSSAWFTAYGYVGDAVDTTRPVCEFFWDAGEKMVWERSWDSANGAYRSRRYMCEDAHGPSAPAMESRGCIYATVIESWLAGSVALEERSTSVLSVALMREPNVAMVPPDPAQAGVWLDVFRQVAARDDDPSEAELYRRQDFMLLDRNTDGEPEVREWRTIVAADERQNGLLTQQITGIRRLTYEFYDSVPTAVAGMAREFVMQVEREVEHAGG